MKIVAVREIIRALIISNIFIMVHASAMRENSETSSLIIDLTNSTTNSRYKRKRESDTEHFASKVYCKEMCINTNYIERLLYFSNLSALGSISTIETDSPIQSISHSTKNYLFNFFGTFFIINQDASLDYILVEFDKNYADLYEYLNVKTTEIRENYHKFFKDVYKIGYLAFPMNSMNRDTYHYLFVNNYNVYTNDSAARDYIKKAAIKNNVKLPVNIDDRIWSYPCFIKQEGSLGNITVQLLTKDKFFSASTYSTRTTIGRLFTRIVQKKPISIIPTNYLTTEFTAEYMSYTKTTPEKAHHEIMAKLQLILQKYNSQPLLKTYIEINRSNVFCSSSKTLKTNRASSDVKDFQKKIKHNEIVLFERPNSNKVENSNREHDLILATADHIRSYLESTKVNTLLTIVDREILKAFMYSSEENNIFKNELLDKRNIFTHIQSLKCNSVPEFLVKTKYPPQVERMRLFTAMTNTGFLHNMHSKDISVENSIFLWTEPSLPGIIWARLVDTEKKEDNIVSYKLHTPEYNLLIDVVLSALIPYRTAVDTSS